jgi:hypothetical protein
VPDAEIPAQRAASGVLVDRMAAALVHREPGWQLPRRSALARRYSVSMAEIDAAIGELSRRSLIRTLPDGQLYRASPAEYLIPLEGVGGLATRLDPMGGEITCQARHVSQRDAPQDVAWALGVAGETQIQIIRCVWAAGGEPVAVSTAYVPQGPSGPARSAGTADGWTDWRGSAPVGDPADDSAAGDGAAGDGAAGDGAAGDDVTGDGAARGPAGDGIEPFPAVLWLAPGDQRTATAAHARAVGLELAPPQPSIARSLRLSPGQPAISVTIRFDDGVTGAPVGLTAVTLKPDRFRVVIQAGGALPQSLHPVD